LGSIAAGSSSLKLSPSSQKLSKFIVLIWYHKSSLIKLAVMKNISLSTFKIPGSLLFAFLLLSFASNAQDKTATTTIKGEVLDMACYMASGAHGEGHKTCATDCIKGGSPMGVLTSDGQVYLLVENHDKKDAYAETKNHAGEQVEVTGTVADKGGVKGIVVNEMKAVKS